MRTILIDPFAMSVTEMQMASLDYDEMRKVVGAEYLDRSSVGGNVMAYVDDTGLRRRGQRFWHFLGSTVLMAGKALLVSRDEEGEPTALAPYATLEFTQQVVAFLGDANGAERAIQKHIVFRPMTTVQTFGLGESKPEVIWEWDHRDCLPEEKAEGGAA